jgi:lactate 2-monooxygenase
MCSRTTTVSSRARSTIRVIENERLACLADAFLYAFGNAGSNSTYNANRKAFDAFKIVPRMLRNSKARDLSVCVLAHFSVKTESTQVTLFGTRYSSPLLIAPVGVQGIWHADAELATARAARNLRVPFIMSTAASRSIEEVARANGESPRWYQLYW